MMVGIATVASAPDNPLCLESPGSGAHPRWLEVLLELGHAWRYGDDPVAQAPLEEAAIAELAGELKGGVNVQTDFWTPLAFCANRGFDRLTRWLLEQGADPNAYVDERLPLAMVMTVTGAELLLQHGADVTGGRRDTRQPVWDVLIAGRTDLAAVLIRHGADVTRPPATFFDDLLGRMEASLLARNVDDPEVERVHYGQVCLRTLCFLADHGVALELDERSADSHGLSLRDCLCASPWPDLIGALHAYEARRAVDKALARAAATP